MLQIIMPLYSVSANITSLPGIITALVSHHFADLIQGYGYLAIFALMLIESIGFPVPSEVIIPLAGYYAAGGLLDPVYAFLAVFAGTTGGLIIDYYVGYYVEKSVVYKHLRFFHISKERLDSFDAWFKKNGVFSVFIVRFIPEIRALISIPAGFAKMPFGSFMAASIAGTFIWDAVLMWFGYRLESASSIASVMVAIGVFGVVLYLLYDYGTKWADSKKRVRDRKGRATS